MNWALDAALVGLVLIIIIINVKKGFETILNFLVTTGSFAAAYFFGPYVGTNYISKFADKRISSLITDVVSKVVGEEAITAGDLLERLPNTLIDLLDRLGIDFEYITESYGETALVDTGTLAEITAKIAEPIANWISVAAGCVLVFLVAVIILKLLKAGLKKLVELPVLKQIGGIIGFGVGAVSSFVWVWIICLAASLFIEYSLLGEYNELLVTLTEHSYIYNFFRDLSISQLL